MVFETHVMNYIILGILIAAYQAVYFFIPYFKKEKEHKKRRNASFCGAGGSQK